MAPRSGPVLDRVRGEERFAIKQLLGCTQILTLCIACIPCTERANQRSERQRRRSAKAAVLGCRSRVNAPFLLPPTRMMPQVVVKSAKFHTCSPTTASIRSNKRWFIST
jgi:hypothetical protein